MDVIFTKGEECDYIEAIEADRVIASTTFPKKGWLPHDAIHLIVERQLGYTSAFWGRVYGGAAPDSIGQIAKAGGHASSSRAEKPAEDIVELLQAERLVECFEAEMLAEPTDQQTFQSVLVAACNQSKIVCPYISAKDIQAIRDQLAGFLNHWRALSIGESLRLSWLQ